MGAAHHRLRLLPGVVAEDAALKRLCLEAQSDFELYRALFATGQDVSGSEFDEVIQRLDRAAQAVLDSVPVTPSGLKAKCGMLSAYLELMCDAAGGPTPNEIALQVMGEFCSRV